MQEAFQALADQQREAIGETGLRVAINTGEVVVKGETDIIGDPVNVAARLQDHGGNGFVVIGESTEHLVANQRSPGQCLLSLTIYASTTPDCS
jgi:class 3 adenylate cyclase